MTLDYFQAADKEMLLYFINNTESIFFFVCEYILFFLKVSDGKRKLYLTNNTESSRNKFFNTKIFEFFNTKIF